MTNKTVIIVEGADATGKTQLCNYLQDLVEGKCHIIHSNYCKNLPRNNHRRQHTMIAKFIAKQFDHKHYTGNKLVILDRNYISDIVYGQIGYGSEGTLKQKLNVLSKLFRIMQKSVTNIIIIHCSPTTSNFADCSEKRQELLTEKEDKAINALYIKFFDSQEFLHVLRKNKIICYKYNFVVDPKHENLHNFLKINGVVTEDE